MSFRWNQEITLKFVSKYVEHECLWNIESQSYKNKRKKQSAYLDIENYMNIPGFGEKEIKTKIKNIRSTYSQELKKIRDSINSGAGNNEVYVPSVKWFSLLDESLSNLNLTLTESESNLSCNDLQTDDAGTDDHISTFCETKFTPPTKKRRINQPSSMVSESKEMAEATKSSVEENEFEVFGKHVGLQLKSLPLLLAIEAQEHIQIHLNRVRRQHLLNEAQKRTTKQPRLQDAPGLSYAKDSP